MRAALGQFAVSLDWQENAKTCLKLINESREGKADLLVLPEGILARDITDPDSVLKSAQPLDGVFMQKILEASNGNNLTIMAAIHVPAGNNRVYNVLVSIRNGAIISTYKKIHLYDAFSAKESKNVEAGHQIPELIDVAGLKVGVMTCYDVRFPELARRLALDGAEVLVLPAAWVKGPLKEYHWQTLVTARALENTCYMLAAGECGARNIGASMAVDPFGVVFARAGEVPGLIFADIDRERLKHARSILPVLENSRFKKPELI